MKALLVAMAVLSCASVASATLVVYEPFAYDATGNPVLGAPATGNKAKGIWSSQGNATNEVRVTAGSLSYPGVPASTDNKVALDNNNGTTGQGADASRLFLGTLTNTTPTVYYSFIASIPAYTVNPTSTEAYFAGFDNTAATVYETGAGLFIKRDADTSKVDLGVSTSGSANRVYSTTAYSPGTVFVVGSFTFGGTATLDVFANGASVPLSAPVTHSAITSGVDTTLASITNFYLRGNPGQPQGINVDEVRVGTAWGDVVPEPGALALLGPVVFGCLARRRS